MDTMATIGQNPENKIWCMLGTPVKGSCSGDSRLYPAPHTEIATITRWMTEVGVKDKPIKLAPRHVKAGIDV